jgi:hypothetical protein
MIKWLYKPSGQCPIQAEGEFLNHYFYFRARWSTVLIEFAPSERHWNDSENIHTYFLWKTESPMAGWVPKWQCLVLIYWGCLRFFWDQKIKQNL